MRTEYVNQLKQLQEDFISLSLEIADRLGQLRLALIDNDKETFVRLAETDHEINQAQVAIERDAISLIALQSPVARDLRTIITVLKSVADLERMGDHLADIASHLAGQSDSYMSKELNDLLVNMTDQVREMLLAVTQAFRNKDAQAAYQVAAMDDEVDKNRDVLFDVISKELQDDPQFFEKAQAYITTENSFERIGDYITNLAEWVVYLETGDMVELNNKVLAGQA